MDHQQVAKWNWDQRNRPKSTGKREYKIKAKLEDTRAAIWARITRPQGSTQKQSTPVTHQPASNQPTTAQPKDSKQDASDDQAQTKSDQPPKPSTQSKRHRAQGDQLTPWFSDHLSALDSISASLKAPPEIKPATHIDVRELR
jgi:hypothetical protein